MNDKQDTKRERERERPDNLEYTDVLFFFCCMGKSAETRQLWDIIAPPPQKKTPTGSL